MEGGLCRVLLRLEKGGSIKAKNEKILLKSRNRTASGNRNRQEKEDKKYQTRGIRQERQNLTGNRMIPGQVLPFSAIRAALKDIRG